MAALPGEHEVRVCSSLRSSPMLPGVSPAGASVLLFTFHLAPER